VSTDFTLATPPDWRCPIVKWHRPRPHRRQRHHVWPIYLGGPEDGPLVGICGACHDDTHWLIELARPNNWQLNDAMTRTYAERVVELAHLGAAAILTRLPPALPAWAVGTAEGR